MQGRRLVDKGDKVRRSSLLAAVLWMVLAAPAAGSPEESPPRFGPFDGPSAAGERLLEEEAGDARRPSAPEEDGGRQPEAFDRGPSVTQAAPEAGNVQANDSALDTGNATTQSETSFAFNDATVCAGYNDSGGTTFSGLSRSPDRGQTWTDLDSLPGGRGDPVLAFHEASGDFLYASIAIVGGDPAIGVARSVDDCQTFAAFADASPLASQIATTSFNDKPWIAVDNTGAASDGNLYVCWTRFDNDGSSDLRVSRSTDAGATFTDEQVLVAGTAPFGCSVQVTADGTVHLAWADRGGATEDDIRYARSTDAGQTYSAPVSLATGNRHPGEDATIPCGSSGTRPVVNGSIRQLHQAWLVADTTGGPGDGNLYAVWASDPAGATDQSDVLFSRSTDGGTTWSAPVDLSPGAGATDQWAPMVAVGGDGRVATMWYDRRDDAAANMAIDVYSAVSDDGGATFSPLERITTQSFGVPQLLPNFDGGVRDCYMGEYNAVVGDEAGFGFFWGDNRNTVTNAQWPAGRPDPDVFFDTRNATDPPDLRTSVSDDPDPVVAGRQLVYTLTVTNDGTGDAPATTLSQTLPAGTSHVSDDGGCDTSALPTLTCALGQLAPGASKAVEVTVGVAPSLVHDNGGPATLSTTAAAVSTAADADPADDLDTEDTDVVAEGDLAVDALAVDAPASAIVGEAVPVTAEVTVSTAGPSTPMDAAITSAGTAAPGGSIAPAGQAEAVPALATGASQARSFAYTVVCDEGGEQEFTIDASVAPAAGAGTDPDASDDARSRTFAVDCVVPVAINVRPGNPGNSANLRSTVVVGLLTTAAGEHGLPLAVDARKVDVSSVRWGDHDLVRDGTGGAPDRRGKATFEDSFERDDMTRDGDKDAVMRFAAASSGLAAGDTEACMGGEIVIGGELVPFFGCDTVVVPPS